MFYEDSKKIAIGLIVIGLFCFTLGVLMFLDRALMTIGNIAFVMGIVALIGPANTTQFFMKKSKQKGSAFFFGGMILILIGWYMFTTVGFFLQLYGVFLLFRSFIKTIFGYI
mmetsp:Transcript_10520/g.7397  ORF Transcript_10520/g.7397 Transcript_10520/m.7397 type:complete len:112 (-) Transcript_10520:189-524(-)